MPTQAAKTTEKKRHWGKAVWHYRDKAGMSRQALARRTELTTTTIFNIEHGIVAEPTYSTLESLATGLDVTVDELRQRADG